MTAAQTPQTPPDRRWAKAAIWLLSIFAVIIILGAGATLLSLNTGWGRSQLADAISGIDAVEVGEINGSLFSTLNVSDIALTDSQGTWATIPQARISWSPWPLFKRTVKVKDVQIPLINVLRAPVSAETPEDGGDPFELKDITAQPVSVLLNNLEIAEIIWNSGDGQQDRVTVAATGRLQRGVAAEIALAVVPLTEGFEDEVNADIALNTKTPAATTKITLKASAGGLLASLMGLPGATNAALEGGGTPGQWAGTLKADVSGQSVADLSANFQSPQGTAQGTLYAQPFLDAALTDIPKSPFVFETQFKKANAQAISFTGNIKNQAIDTTFGGTVSAPGGKPTGKDLTINTVLSGTAAQINMNALTAQLTLDGELENLTGKLRLKAKTISAADLSIAGLEINGEAKRQSGNIIASAQGGIQSIAGIEGLDPSLLNALQFSAEVAAGDGVSGTAQINNRYFDVAASNVAQTPDGTLSADIAFSAADLSQFPSAIEAALTGKAKVSQSSAGKTSIVVSTTLTPQKGTQHWIGRLAQGPLQIKARAGLSEGTLSVPALSLKSDRTDIAGKGTLNGDTVEATLKGTIAGAAFADLAPGAGEAPATFNLAAKGPLSTVIPQGTLTLPGLSAADIVMRDLLLELAPMGRQNGNQTAFTLTGRSSAGPIKANAVIERFKNGDISLEELSARIANITALGSVTVDAAEGPAADMTIAILPLTLAESGLLGLSGDIEIRAQLTNGAERAVRFSGGGPLLTYGPRDTPTAQLRTLQLDGTLDLDADTPRLVATLDAKALEAAGLFFDSASLQAQQEGETQTAQVILKQSGQRATNAVIDIDMRASDGATVLNITPSGQLAGAPLGSDGPITLTVSDTALSVAPTVLAIGGGVVELQHTQSASAQNTDLEIKDFQLRTVTDLLQQPAYMGQLSSTMSLASKPNTGTMNAAFEIENLSTNAASQANLSLRGTVQASKAALTADIFAGQGTAKEDLKARLELPVSWPQTPSIFLIAQDAPLKADIALDTRLGPWWELADQVDQTLRGVLKANLTIRGTLQEPQPDGKITLSETRYEHLDLGTQLDDLDAEIILQNKQITLSRLTANDGRGGTLNASAVIDIFPAAPQRSQIILKDFQLLEKNGLSARADADLALAASNDRLGLTGDITIAEARYAISTDGAAAVPTLPIEEINKGALDGQAPGTLVVKDPAENVDDTGLPPPDLAISVNAPRRIFVTGMGLSSEWRTDLDVTGTAGDPSVAGTVQLVRGELEFAGRRFQLERGQIFLDGGQQIEPRLDILAQNIQGDFTARIGITGTPADPKITLSSTPALPDDEILSRILFGTSATDLSALEAVQLGSAIAALSNGGGSSALDIAGKARSATGLDRLSLGSNDSSTAITGGKYLSEDVYLQFTTDPSSGQYLAAIEWYLTRTLSLLSEYGAQTGSNVAARWSRTY